MTPAAIPVARRMITEFDARELRGVAARVLKLETAPEIEQYLADALTNRRTLERY